MDAHASLLAKQLQVAMHLRPSIPSAKFWDSIHTAFLQKEDGTFQGHPALDSLFGSLKHKVP